LTILKQILDEIKTDDQTQKMRELCDQIQIEESKSHNKDIQPKGPNIFLSIEAPGKTDKEIAFLTLERETPSKYLVILYAILKNKLQNEGESLKRKQVWEIEDIRPEKILTFYAHKLKYLKGE